jgi:hypothetical protein
MILAFITAGTGRALGSAFDVYSAFRVDAGETLTLDASETAEMLVITLPLVSAPRVAEGARPREAVTA